MTHPRSPAHLEAWERAVMEEAREQAKAGHVEEAIALYRQILADPWPKHWDALHELLELCYRHGRSRDAVRFVSEVAESYEQSGGYGGPVAWWALTWHDPLNYVPYVRIAELGSRHGRLSLRERAFLQSAHERFLANGVAEEAALIKAAGDFGPEDAVRFAAEGHARASQEALGKGDEAEADRCLREAVRLDPHNEDALRGLRDLCLLRDDLQGAAEACSRLAALARGRGKNGDRYEAEARRRDPRSVQAWLDRGAELEEEGRGERAGKAYRAALDRDPRSAEAWYGLGRLAHWREDRGGEREAHGQLERLDPARAAAFAGEFLDLDAARPARSIRFPSDVCLGTLLGRDSRRSGAWRPIGDAQGVVRIPAGKDVRLEVRELALGEAPDLRPLSLLRPDDLQQLSLEDVRVDDDGLRSIAGLIGLTWLSLRGTDSACAGILDDPSILIGTRIGDASLIDGCGVSDRGLRHLAGLTNLRELDISIRGVSSEGLAVLVGLEALELLAVGHSRVGDGGLEHVVRLRNLRALDMKRTEITDAGLARLARLPRLDTLLVGSNDLSGAGSAALRSLPALRRLDVSRTWIDVEHLVRCSGLEHLNLTGNPIGDEELLALARLPRLAEVSVADTQVTPGGVAAFLARAGREITVLQDLDPNWQRPSRSVRYSREP